MDQTIADLLRKIETLDASLHFSQIPKQVGQILHALVLASGSKVILELGTSAGYSTIWLAAAAKINKGQVYTIENDPKKIILAKKHFEESGLVNIELIEEDIMDSLEKWSKKIDFLFIDAEKSGYLDYFNLVEKNLMKNSVIVADNIKTIGKGTINVEKKTKNYMNFFKDNSGYECILLEIGDGLLVSIHR